MWRLLVISYHSDVKRRLPMRYFMSNGAGRDTIITASTFKYTM